MKVLVVDDAASVRARLIAMLEEVPGVLLVLGAERLVRAAELLRAAAPEVVVLDLHLKGECGLTFVPVVKRERPDTLVVVMTNQPTAAHRRACLALGVDRFFDKSRDFQDVLQVVAEAAAPTRTRATSDA